MENKKVTKCSVCQTEMEKSVKTCPSCGAKNKKPIYKKWWCWLIVFVVVVAIIGGSGNNDNSADSSKSANSNAKTEQNEKSNQDKPKVKTYKSGMYKIGVDMPAGEYVIIGSGYGQLASDSTGDLESIITNDNYSNIWYIGVNDGEYLTFQGGKAYALADAPTVDTSSKTISEGMYKIGRDFPAGEYKVTAQSDGYIEVSSGNRGSLEQIVSNDNFTGDKYITVSDGQYLKLIGCKLNLK